MQKQTIDKHIHNNSDRECICPICHKDDWQVTDDIIYIRMAGEKLSIAGILCNNCGFIMNRKVQEYIR